MAQLGEPSLSDPHMTPLRVLLLVLVVGFTPLGAAGQQYALGPLTWEEGSPIQRLAIAPAFEGAQILRPGSIAMDLWLGYSNIFEQDSTATHVLFIDTERLLTALTVRWGAATGIELGGRVTLETTGGGILDGFVSGYHELLGFGQANRDRFPQDAYAQRLSNGSGALLLDIPQRTMAVEDLQVFAKWRVTASQDERNQLSLRGSLRAPVATNTVGRERTDGAVVALGRVGAGNWYVHGMLGAGVVRASPELEGALRDWSAFAGVAVERALGERMAAVAQLQVAGPLLRGFDHRELDWPANNLVLGLAGRLGDAWSWDASFQEDVPADTPAIDFTASLRVSRTWR